MTLKSDPNFEEKLTFCLKNDMNNLVNFNSGSEKSENLHGIFLIGYIYQKYVMFELKNRNKLCREKRLMVSKMTKEIS